MYCERTHCIFCENTHFTSLFQESKHIPLGSYNTDKPYQGQMMPINILICSKCGTGQTQYLGDLNEIYKINHAFAFGSILNGNNKTFIDKILKHTEVTGVIEVGAGSGILADHFIELLEVPYTIIDPYYFGKDDKRTILRDYINNIDISNIQANTLIMSHVFEHLYEPLKLIQSIQENIEYVCINFPDLEGYVRDGTYHVLNPEHIYYIENQFLVDVFKKYGFDCLHQSFYEGHSVHFIFKRSQPMDIVPMNLNTQSSLIQFYQSIHEKVAKIQALIDKYPDYEKYIWPCSIHNLYLFTFGLDIQSLNGILDNSPHKLNKYLYGTNLYCQSLNAIAQNETKKIIILNVGCFNKEVLLESNTKTQIFRV
jgi:hypothetical protein